MAAQYPSRWSMVVLIIVALATMSVPSFAQSVVALNESFAGDYNYTVIGGSLRTNPNSGPGANACALGANDSEALAGIPPGSTIVAAYLYWGGSGATVDNQVTLNGNTIIAERTFTDVFVLGNTYRFFGGFADVTGLVNPVNGQNFTFGGLTVTNGAPFCAVQAVLASWSLLVVYENQVTEPLRVINVFDGFQIFRGGSITLTQTNFRVPATPEGSRTIVTWEGDVENSAPLNGFTENLTFNGTPLTDALNPLNNQFNSTLNQPGTTTEYGTDIDRYDVSALLSPGDTSSTTVYSSGGDLVILTLEVIAVSNLATADLGIDKSHSGSFLARQNNDYTIVVSNEGPSIEAATITVSDTLPAGLTFVSGTGAGWACAAAGQDVTCTNNTATAAGDDFPALTLTVFADLTSVPGVTNTATVASPTFDNQGSNNSDSDPTVIVDEDPSLVVLKASQTITDPVNGTSDPKAIPGADVRYSIIVSNAGIGPVDNGSLIITDSLPADTALFVDSSGGAPVTFSDGTPSSELVFDFATDIAFTDAPGGAGPFDYIPVPDADGYDTAITGFEIRPRGIFIGNAAPGSPTQFTLNFIVRLE